MSVLKTSGDDTPVMYYFVEAGLGTPKCIGSAG